jgi:hypothetical protein
MPLHVCLTTYQTAENLRTSLFFNNPSLNGPSNSSLLTMTSSTLLRSVQRFTLLQLNKFHQELSLSTLAILISYHSYSLEARNDCCLPLQYLKAKRK